MNEQTEAQGIDAAATENIRGLEETDPEPWKAWAGLGWAAGGLSRGRREAWAAEPWQPAGLVKMQYAESQKSMLIFKTLLSGATLSVSDSRLRRC